MIRLCLCIALLAMSVVGCVDDCPNGVCPPQEQSPNPFADPAYGPLTPSGIPYLEPVSVGREVIAAPSTLVNHAATSESKSGCPNGVCPVQAPVVTPAQAPVVRRPITLPWQTHRLIYPPIRLNPGEVLLKVNPPGVMTIQQTATAKPKTMPIANAGPRCECPDCKCPDCTGPGCGCCPDCPPNQCTTGTCPMNVQGDNVPREGVFACQRCGRETVGADWHELWADDDTSLTCLCESCWQAMSPDQRSAELYRYAREQCGVLSPIVTDAIREAAVQ